MKIKRRPLEAGVPAVAMADIAFNLVLFFIIMARAQDDSYLKWKPAHATEVKRFENAAATVTVDEKNKIYLNGKEVGVKDLTPRIETLLGSAAAGKRTVLLKIHRDTLAATFKPIIEAVSNAGGDIVHVLADEKKGE